MEKTVPDWGCSFKGSGHILPDNEENHEYFQWLVSEVISRGGEGAFVRVDRIESMTEKELITLLIKIKKKEYRPVQEGAEALERTMGHSKKTGAAGTE